MSTEVSAHLFYGLFVTTSSLYIASEAFKKVQGPLLAIQLLLLRKSTSTLQITKSKRKATGSIINLPVEVWTMIKLELIGIELIKAQKELANRYVCDECRTRSGYHHLFRRFASSSELAIATRWEEFPINGCDDCHDNVFYDHPWLNLDLDPIQSLLACYDLELYPNNIDDDEMPGDRHPLSAVGVKRNSQECHESEEIRYCHAITTLSSTSLELPFSVDFISRQFKSLSKDYGVEFRDPRTKTNPSQTTSNVVGKESEEKKDDVKKDFSIPGWHLWTRGVING